MSALIEAASSQGLIVAVFFRLLFETPQRLTVLLSSMTLVPSDDLPLTLTSL